MVALFAAISGVALATVLAALAVSPKFHHGRHASFTSVTFGLWMVASVILTSYTFAVRGGGLPDLSLERMFFIALFAFAIVRIRNGSFLHNQGGAVEILMLLFSIWCFISMGRFGFFEIYSDFPRPTFIYLTGYGIPFLMYIFVKRFFMDDTDILVLLKILFWFGCYLAWLAYMERFGIKSLVLPSYILDPSISPLHLDRSRGPFLNAAFNGLALNVTLLCGLMVLPALRGFARGVHILLILFYLPAIYFTRTRSVYLGLVLILIVMVFMYKTTWSKWKFIPVIILAGLLAIAVNWSKLTSEDREAGGIGQMKEVEIRLDLMRKSLNLIIEHPFGGIGLAQFRTASLFTPTEVELQHNQLIGLAVELGIPGMLLYIAIFGVLFSRIYRVAGVMPDHSCINANFLLLLTTLLFVDLLNNMLVEPSLHLFANTNFFVFAGISDQLYYRYYKRVAPPLGCGRL